MNITIIIASSGIFPQIYLRMIYLRMIYLQRIYLRRIYC